MVAEPTVVRITDQQAEAYYAAAMEKMRERHDKGEPWEMAATHVVIYMSEWDASVIFGYLQGQAALAIVDKLLAEALAKRLGLVIEFCRKEIKEGWE